MTTYFRPDPNLRAAYGGGAIMLDGSSQETNPSDMTCRQIAKSLGVVQKGVEYSLRMGTATVPTAGTAWLYCPDSDYALISGFLTAAELATVTTTAPTGFAANNNRPAFSPSSSKPNILFVGDSITAGVGYGASTETETRPFKTLMLLNGATGPGFVTNKVYNTPQYRAFNNGIGSSSFANTQPPDNDFLKVWLQRRAQALDTLPLSTGVKNIMVVSLGTNDMAYDASVTGAICWARAQAMLTAIRAAHGGNLKVIVATQIKRSEAASPNNRLNDFNVLMRANWASVGFDGLADIERLTVDNSGTYVAAPYYPYKLVTDGFGAAGNTTNLNYYIDGTHPAGYSYTLEAPVFAAAINAFL
jgi:lysophospholipase L1-like esterase